MNLRKELNFCKFVLFQFYNKMHALAATCTPSSVVLLEEKDTVTLYRDGFVDNNRI